MMAFSLKRFFAGISANTVHAANVASSLLGIQRDTIFITYNGIDFSLLKPERSAKTIRQELGIRDNEVVVGTSGNLRQLKRIDLLIRALAQLGNARIRCCIVGDGPDKARLAQLSADLGVTDQILFAGKTTCIADSLQVFDIFVLPSDESESFGNSVVEAMGLGIPSVVMRDGGGTVEHIPEEGGLIAQDLTDLTSKLAWLADNEPCRRRMGQIGKSYVTDKYSYENSIKSYNLFYESALENRGRRP
jgi:glycosyltransferase involved in cell wall biosynthesis